MPMPLVPRSPRPRMRPPSVTTMICTCRAGQQHVPSRQPTGSSQSPQVALHRGPLLCCSRKQVLGSSNATGLLLGSNTSAGSARAAPWPHIVAGPVPEDLSEAPLLIEGTEVHPDGLPAASTDGWMRLARPPPQSRVCTLPGQQLRSLCAGQVHGWQTSTASPETSTQSKAVMDGQLCQLPPLRSHVSSYFEGEAQKDLPADLKMRSYFWQASPTVGV